MAIKGITIELTADTGGLEKGLKKVSSENGKLNKELKDINRMLKFDPKNTELLAQKQQVLAEKTKLTQDKLEALKKAKEKADEDMKNGTKINEAEYRALQREIIDTESYLGHLTKETSKFSQAGKKIGEVGEKLNDVGKKMLPVTGAITALGVASVKSASEFEDAFAKVTTIADETEVSTEDLQKAIKKLSNETGIDATDIADNVYNAISAGQKTGDAVNFVSNATKLAKAGFADSASALDILTTAMNAYGMESDQVGRVSDLLIQTQNLGKTTVAELSSAMGKVIPTAKANNVEIDQLCTGYAILTANGIATAESTTYMNSMLNELGKGGTGVDKILREKTGKSFSQLSAEGKTMGDVLSILDDYAKKNQKSFGDLWGSAEAGKAGLVLLGNGADTFNSKLAEMNNSTGATDTAFEKLDTNSNKVKIAVNELKNTSTELGDTILGMLAPIIEDVSKKISEFSEWFSGLDENQKKTIVTIGLVVASIGPLLIIAGTVCSSISSIIGLTTTLKAVTTAQTAATTGATTAQKLLNFAFKDNPIGIVITIIMALVGAFVLLWNNCEGFRNFWISLWDKIKKGVSDAVEFIKKYWKDIGLFLINPLAGAFDLLYKLNPKFKEWVDNLINSIKEWFGDIKSIGINMVNGIWDGFKETFSGMINKIKGLIDLIPETIKKILGIHSPSRVMRDEVGVMISRGIAVGITKASGEVNEAFKNLMDDLNLQRDLELISEEEYYNQVEKLRNEYLEKGTSDWWNYTKDLVKYAKSLKTDMQKTFEDIASNVKSKIDSIMSDRDRFAESLTSGYKLFETVELNGKTGKITAPMLNDWADEEKFLSAYDNTMNKVSERLKSIFGDDKSGYAKYMQELRDLGTEDGGTAAALLLGADDTELEKHIRGWQSVMNRANQAANNQYADSIKDLQNNFIDEITKSLGTVPDEYKTSGETAAKFFGQGFMENISSILENISSTLTVSLGDMMLNDFQRSLNTLKNTSIDNSRTNNITINANGGNSGNVAYSSKKALQSLILAGVL